MKANETWALPVRLKLSPFDVWLRLGEHLPLGRERANSPGSLPWGREWPGGAHDTQGQSGMHRAGDLAAPDSHMLRSKSSWAAADREMEEEGADGLYWGGFVPSGPSLPPGVSVLQGVAWGRGTLAAVGSI